MNATKAIVIAVALMGAGCSREAVIEGQVFVARKDRETVRLSATRIYMVPARAIESEVSAFEADAKTWDTRLIATGIELLDEKKKLEQLKDENENTAKALIYAFQDVEAEIGAIERRVGLELARYPKLPPDSKRRTDFLIANLQTNLTTLREKRKEIRAKLANARAEADRASREIEEKMRKIQEARRQAEEPPIVERLFFAVENAKPTSTVTDADGRFKLVARMKEKPIIFVRAARSVPMNGSENYVWIHRVNGTNTLLWNENVTLSWKAGEK